MREETTSTGRHFTCLDDIRFLRTVRDAAPWKATRVMDAWNDVVTRLKDCADFAHREKDGRALRSRFVLLIKKYRANAVASIRTTGSAAQRAERDALLKEISDALTLHDGRKAEETSALKRVRSPSIAVTTPAVIAGVMDLSGVVDAREQAAAEPQVHRIEDFDVEPPRKKAVYDANLKSSEQGDDMEIREANALERLLEQQQQFLHQQHQQLEMQREQFARHVEFQTQQMELITQLVHKLTCQNDHHKQLQLQRDQFERQLELQQQQMRLITQLVHKSPVHRK